jgi:AcrR family transcriptional regulator
MAYVLIDERRARFIAATLNVIRERGIANATTRRIAEEAGVPLASLHYTFNKKEELFVATMKELAEAGQREVAAKVSEGMGVANAAAAIVNAYIDWIKSSRVDQVIEYELHLWAHRRPDLKHLPSESYGVWVEFIRELLTLASADGPCNIDIDSLARTVLALIDGFNLQCQLYNDDMVDLSREAATNALRQSVENGDFPKSSFS